MKPLSTRKRLWLCLVLLTVSAGSTAHASDTAALLGTWKATIDYEPHVLTFLSAQQLKLDDEVHDYTLRSGVIEVNYEDYPFRLDGDSLFVTADGREHRFSRVTPAQPLLNVKQLVGFWKSKTEWGTQYLNIVSDKEVEFGGERTAYSLVTGGVQVNGTFYPCRLKNGQLTVDVPDEGQTVVFKRDHSVLQGAWIARQDGYSTPLTFYDNNELSFDYQYADYTHVPGAIRVENTDYPYHFEGKYMVGKVDGVEMKFQRDPAQFIGTWETTSPGRIATLNVYSATQLEYDGQSAAYTLMPGSIYVDGQWIPYRLVKGNLVVISPEEGELVFKKKK